MSNNNRNKGVPREQRAIDAIACPTCGAPAGKQCGFVSGTPGRPACCSERRRAWQEARQALVDAVIRGA